jgi:hypothetical protein
LSSYTKRHHKYHIKSKYGITEEAFDVLFQAQKGLCRICGEKDFRRLAVDHDHLTKRIRGLLCTSCNMGLGYFKDNPNLLINAIEYLK